MKKRMTMLIVCATIATCQVRAGWWECTKAVGHEILASAAVVVACDAAVVSGGIAWAACVAAAEEWVDAVQEVSDECF